MIKGFIRSLFAWRGYSIVKERSKRDEYFDMEEEFFGIFEKCKEYTMTSMGKMYGIFKSIEYIEKHGIEGDIVECGVWRGGSSMNAALSLLHFKSSRRKIYLYDTYEGMPQPGEKDVDIFDQKASDLLTGCERCKSTSDDPTNYWARVDIDEVRLNMSLTNYPEEKIFFVKGKVEDTIPETIPDKIAVLRLDTDWYESTYHVLTQLFPAISPGGVLILDDYGYWKGARGAVDRYFKENKIPILLNRLDDGRIAVKYVPKI
jgi:O-methyltransferase